jgi:hypothetical protein
MRTLTTLTKLMVSLSATVALCGCSTVADLYLVQPEIDANSHLKPEADSKQNPPPTVREIEKEIQCEVRRTVLDNADQFQKSTWVAAATLTLQVDDGAQLSPTLSFIDPLNLASSFTFGVGATISGSRQRIFTETVTYAVNTILAKPDAQKPVQSCAFKNDLSGNLEIESTAVAALDAAPGLADDPTSPGKNNNAFGETVQFVVLKNVNGVGPTWALKTFKGPGGLAGASRTDTQKLVISFGAAPKPNGSMMSLLLQSPAMLESFSRRNALSRFNHQADTDTLLGTQNFFNLPMESLTKDQETAMAPMLGLTSENFEELVREQNNLAQQQSTDSATATALDQNLIMQLQSLHSVQ